MLVQLRGCTAIADVARDLGYERAEKLSRLTRGTDAQPSADIIVDVAKTFVNLNLRWWLTGEGAPVQWGTRLLTDQEADAEFPRWRDPQVGSPTGSPTGYPAAVVVPGVLAEPVPGGARPVDILTDVLVEVRALSDRVMALESGLKGTQ